MINRKHSTSAFFLTHMMLRSRANRESGEPNRTTKKKRKKKTGYSLSNKGGPSNLAIALLLLFSGFVVLRCLSTFSSSTLMDDVERERHIADFELLTSSLKRKTKELSSSSSIYDLTFPDIHGTPMPLDQYRDFVTLVVNVACF